LSRTDRIKRCVVENFIPDVVPADLPDDYDLLDSGVVTSLGLVKLITLLAREFDVDIDAADVRPDHFRTVAAIDRFLEETTAPAPAVAH
jgi:acyl carrier protein